MRSAAPQMALRDASATFDNDAIVSDQRLSRGLVETVSDALRRRFGTWEKAAEHLDAIFGPLGRPVSASMLRAAFAGAERNNPRIEWIVVVLDDPEVRAVFSPPVTDPRAELAEIREYMAKRATDALESYDRKRGRR